MNGKGAYDVGLGTGKSSTGNGTGTYTEPQRTPLTASASANALIVPSTPPPSAPLSSSISPASDLASRLANFSLRESPAAPSPEARESPFLLDSPTAPRLAHGEPARGAADSALGMILGDETSSGAGEQATGLVGGSSAEPVAPLEAAAPLEQPAVPPPLVLDELALLAVSSSVAELLMGIQDLNTLLFEIQELRHATSAAPSADPQSTPRPASNGFAGAEGPSPVSEVDTALMRLDAKMEEVRKEYASVEAQVQPLLASSAPDERGELRFLQQKWDDAVADWETVQKDADMLGDELKEDKWLTVARTVSGQASDMMRSLDKVLVQSQQFVSDVRRYGRSSGHPSSPGLPRSPSAPAFLASTPTSLALDTVKAQHLLASFNELHRSLHAKVKYYSPACARVLAILQKGVADRSTKNGEVLRRLGDMKAQWKSLQERVQLVEHDMRATERLLKEAAGAPRASEFGSTLTPPRDASTPGRVSPMRRSPSAFASLSLGPPPVSTPARGGPLRPSASSPSVATLGTVSSPDNPLRASISSSSRPTPPRPPKSLKRLVSDSQASPHSGLTPPRAPFTLSHRRSVSAMSASYSGLASSVGSAYGARSGPQPRRPVSPTPSAVLESRPRWNASVRLNDDREVLSSAALASSTKPRSGRISAAGVHRPSSRLSLASSMSRSYGPGAARPVSPAFSDASSVAYRDRPETPSRIPRPSSAMRRQSGAFGFDDPDASFFGRAVSPTPSASRPPPSASSRYSLSRSMGPPSSSRTRAPTAGSSKGASRPTSPALSATSSSYYRMQTPEPSLMAQAQRLAGVRAPPSASRAPPVPRVPSSYRQDAAQGAARGALSSSSSSARPSRPPSSLASYRLDQRSTTPLPPGGEPGAYVPNAKDPLDAAVAVMVNSLPLLLRVVRVDPPLSPHANVEVHSARYIFGLPSRPLDDQRKAVMCKLVDRVGPRARKGEKKVLVRVGGGWQDLETYTLGLMASSV
ncbi:hypothetical protein JCM10450v2_005283 [Rhodotorula kratochvilovae]